MAKRIAELCKALEDVRAELDEHHAPECGAIKRGTCNCGIDRLRERIDVALYPDLRR